ncbi:MAG TPA: DUF6544 family protein [Gaiellaceae bacterium]|nr:DUF6544 family protein [Gaiellaceae bacterium]
MAGSADAERLPERLRTFLARSLPPGGRLPARVRVTQHGEMIRRPGARPLRFEAVEEFAVAETAFSWRARFGLAGPLAVSVTDELAGGRGALRVRLLGLPVQSQEGPELAVGQAMRYLAELPWAPQAIAGNRALEWREADGGLLEVAAAVGSARAVVEWELDGAGDLVRASGTRPYRSGDLFVPTLWGGDLGGYASFEGTRVPTAGEAWWELPEGRFVYWRGRVTGLELVGG